MLDDDKLAKAGNDTATPEPREPKAPKAPAIDKDANPAEREEAELNAALSKAFRASQERGDLDDDEGDDEPPARKPKEARKPAGDDEVAAKRERGPDGKFKGKDGDEEKPEKAEKAAPKPNRGEKESEVAESDDDDSADEKASKPIQAKDKPAESSDEDDSDESEAPESWRGKSVWRGMSREARQHAAARETAHTETAKKLEAYSPVGHVLNSFQGTFARHGVPFDKGLAMVLRAQDALDQDPPTAIRKIAESYGVDLRQLVGATQNDPAAEIDDAFDSPRVRQLEERLARFEQAEAQRQHQMQQQAQQRAQQVKQTNLGVVDAFIAKVAQYPHAAEVGQEILAALPLARRENPGLEGEALLAKAYDKAIRLNEKVWAKVQAAEKAKADADRKERDAAKKAKDADALNVGDEAHDQVPDDDEDALLRRTFRRATARAERRAA